MGKAAVDAALIKFDKNWDYGQIKCGRCKANFWVEDGTGKRVSLLFKDRCKGLCNDCIGEVLPRNMSKVRNSVREWWGATDRQLKKREEGEFGEH